MSEFEKIRKSFRPERITTLFVGESAPSGGTFFYNENSNLFRCMKRAFDGQATFLDDFKSSGFYLDDLVLIPVNKLERQDRSALRQQSISALADRLADYKPMAIVILMHAIVPMVRKAMLKAGISCESYSTPFPTFGNQNRFHNKMIEIIRRLPVRGDDNRKELTA